MKHYLHNIEHLVTLEVDFHEWCHRERVAREEAMRQEQGHLRHFLDTRLVMLYHILYHVDVSLDVGWKY